MVISMLWGSDTHAYHASPRQPPGRIKLRPNAVGCSSASDQESHRSSPCHRRACSGDLAEAGTIPCQAGCPGQARAGMTAECVFRRPKLKCLHAILTIILEICSYIATLLIRGRHRETSCWRSRVRKPAFGARNPNPGRLRASSRTALGPLCKVLAGLGQGDEADRKSTRLNSSHVKRSRMPSSA